MPEPLVLLPGMMCDGRLFAPQIAAFSAQRPIMVVTSTAGTSMTGFARQILDIAPPEFALAGLSMGGIIAMEILRLAPARITRLALMDTNPLADPPEKAPLRQSQVAKVKAGKLRDVMRDEMKPTYLADGPLKAQVLDLCMDMAETLGPEVFVRQSRALQSRPDQSDTLRGANVPALILCGRDDTLCPIERHEYMAGLMPQASLQIIENAGHLPTLEQPKETTDALLAWLG